MAYIIRNYIYIIELPKVHQTISRTFIEYTIKTEKYCPQLHTLRCDVFVKLNQTYSIDPV